MKTAANNAAQSSADSYPFPKYNAIEIPTNAAMDVMASLLWCQASAFNEELFVSIAFFITNRYETSFQIIIFNDPSSFYYQQFQDNNGIVIYYEQVSINNILKKYW